MAIAFRWRVLGGLAVLILIAQAPALVALWQGNAPFGGDALSAFAPWREFSRQSQENGIIPLWNPHIFCGMPFFSNGQSALLYPPNLIYSALPVATAQWIDVYAHQVLLAMGGYTLARALNLSRISSVLVALLLALGNAVTARLYAGHMTWHEVRAWIPWLLCFTLLFLRHGTKRYAVSAALCLVFLFAAGHPPMAMLGLLLDAGLILAYFCAHRKTWQRLPWSLIFGALILAATLSAASILPMREASELSLRQSGMLYKSAIVGSGSWRSFVRLLLPDFFGGNAPTQWSIRILPFEEAASLGLIPALMALGAPWLARRNLKNLPRAVPWLWSVMLIAGLLALGNKTPAYHLAFDYVPLFKSLHVPVRWLELWYLMAALLAGFAFEGCRQQSAPYNKICIFILGLIGCGLLIFALFIAYNSAASPLWLKTAQWNAERTEAEALVAAETLRHAALVACLTGSLVAGAGAFLFSRLTLGRVWQHSLVGLMALQLMALSWISAVPVTNEVKSALVWPERLTAKFKTGDRWDSNFKGIWAEYAWNGGLPHGIDLFNGYDPFGPMRFYIFASAMEERDSYFYPYQPRHRSTLLRVAGVTHTLQAPLENAPQTTFGTPKLVWRSDSWVLWHHKGAWPRVYLTNHLIKTNVKKQLKTLEKLAASDFYRQNKPVVVAPNDFSVSGMTSAGRVLKWTRGLNRVDVDLKVESPAVLVIGDAFYPGWHAYEGRFGELKLAPANYLFRGVQVPKGAGHVTLVYEPQTVRFAFFVSLCGLASLFFVGAQVAPRFLKKRS